MTEPVSRTTLVAVATGTDTPHQARYPDLGRLDLLGRMPIPLRRPFKSGLDRVVTTHQAATGIHLDCCFLSGGEWYRPFDGLAAAVPNAALPGMLISPLYHDLQSPRLMARYISPAPPRPAGDWHPACQEVGLADPLGGFRTFAFIPFVFLVDERRLRGRPVPRAWEDLLDPVWAGDIVFGGWRPNDRVPYQDYNGYLLFALHQEFGDAGLAAFGCNVLHLQHNIRTATRAGSNSTGVRAIAILPWLQAELCPRRDRTRVVWPADGALVMPIGYLLQPTARPRLDPLVDFVTGQILGRVLARNCYPPVAGSASQVLPPGARLKWPGWEAIRGLDLAHATRLAAQHFFAAWAKGQEVRACG